MKFCPLYEFEAKSMFLEAAEKYLQDLDWHEVYVDRFTTLWEPPGYKKGESRFTTAEAITIIARDLK